MFPTMVRVFRPQSPSCWRGRPRQQATSRGRSTASPDKSLVVAAVADREDGWDTRQDQAA
jgi:hypothetical protein